MHMKPGGWGNKRTVMPDAPRMVKSVGRYMSCINVVLGWKIKTSIGRE